MFLHRKLAAAFLVLTLGGVVGCATPPPQNRFAEITFEHLDPIRLDVAEVVMEQSYVPPNETPNVDHLFPVAPADGALRWAGDRLVAKGTSRRAHFIVRDASAIEESLDTSDGITGILTVDQSERYSGHIMVELQIFDGNRLEGTASAEARRSITVPEDLSLREREEVWYQLTEDILADLNRELEKVISSTYAPYLL